MDEIWAKIFDVQDIQNASTGAELRGVDINVGSANEFFQACDRNSRVLLNKDSLKIVCFSNEISSLICKTFNFWETF